MKHVIREREPVAGAVPAADAAAYGYTGNSKNGTIQKTEKVAAASAATTIIGNSNIFSNKKNRTLACDELLHKRDVLLHVSRGGIEVPSAENKHKQIARKYTPHHQPSVQVHRQVSKYK